MNTQENIFVNGWSITFQRILGGLLVVVVVWALHQTFPRWSWFAEQTRPTAPHRKPWLWSLANGLAGPTLGVACFQMALLTTPSAVVLPIAATSSLLVMPMAYHVEGDKPGWRSLLGGLMAIGGVFALIQIRS
jgi:drug/metabolite transporter (DMT)-like permease